MALESPASSTIAGRLLHAVLREGFLPLAMSALAVTLLSASLWNDGTRVIEDFSSTLIGIRRLVAGDSEHYLAIASAFGEGDFRMEHLEPGGGSDRAHRQPGYPALLAAAQKLGVEGAPALARVDLALLVVSLWIAFVAARITTGSALAGVFAATIVYDARFLFDIATGRLLTEPLYVAVALGAVGTCLSYLTRPGAISLLAAAVLSGVAYLVRVNGLFLAAALAVAMIACDLIRARRADPVLPSVDLVLHLPLSAYAAALALFLAVTTPSWVPRMVYTGNPVYHGYLSNFLWVDDYGRAHVPGAARYSASTYLAEHGAGDAAERLWYGIQRVFYETPRDKYGPAVTAALAIAIVVVFTLRDVPGVLLALAAVLQAMPLAWTAMANPARRLPAAALLPFTALVIACAVAATLRRVHPPARD